MKRMRSLPHVLYSVRRDALDRLHIRCRCEICGDSWQRRCDYPRRATEWISRFAALHAHQ